MATAVVLVAILGAGGYPAPARGQAAEDRPSAPLERTLVDVATLSDGDGAAPRLLTIEGPRVATDGVATVAVSAIEGEPDGWRTVSALTVTLADLQDALPGTPWLIGLDDERAALLVPGRPDRTLLVGLRIGAEAEIRETGRQVLDATVDDAGAADVDGDGTQELVLATAQTLRAGATCQGSTIRTLSGGVAGPPAVHLVEGFRLAGGVVGRWDERPGDDLLAYAYPNCPAGPDDPSRAARVVIRLEDGALVRTDDVGGDRLEGLPWLGPPARLDIDGAGLHEAIAMTAAGLAIVDPQADWRPTALSERLGFPVTLGPSVPRDGPTRVAWLDLGGPDAVATATVERGADGAVAVTLGHRPGATRDPRSDPIVIEAIGALGRGDGVWGWEGALADPGCPVTLVPGTATPCEGGDSDRGPLWIGTRPLLAYGPSEGRRLVAAAGLVMNPANAYPATPSPWAMAPSGAWRHGPSVPFVLADLSVDDVLGSDAPRGPEVVLPDPVARDGVVEVAGPIGTRAFVLVQPLREDGADPGPAPSWAGFVGDGEDGTGPTVLRLGGAAGAEPPAGSGSASIGLPDWEGPRPARRWSLAIAAIDDRGTLARPIMLVVERDLEPPAVALEAPFLSAPWPFAAGLVGNAEPGARVTVEGVGEVVTDGTGSFTIDRPLAPWPQTLRLVARDAAGNETPITVSVVGGLDYRQLPWIWILGLLLVLAAGISGLRAGRSPSTPGYPTAGPAAGDSGVEFEELPPRLGPR